MRGRKRTKILLIALLLTMPSILSCGGGGNGGALFSRPSTTHVVTLTWASNRETGVNSAGGYYEVSISGKPTITVPYTVASITTVLQTGSYSVTMRAHAALDSQGTTTGSGSFSAPSQSLSVNVP